MKKMTSYIVKVIEQKWWVVLVIAMLLTFVLCLLMGKGQDIWFDESYSIILAKQPLATLIGLTGVDAHPPLYYILLKVWGSVFGWSELALRSLSALFAALTVGVMGLLVRLLFGTRSMLCTLPLLVLAPFWLRYGYEIRMYSLAGLIAVSASFVLIKAIQAKSNLWLWALYGMLVAAGMYTLYMTVVIWLAHVIWLAVYHRKNFFKQPWVWSYCLAILFFIPYMSTFFYQLTHSALPGIGREFNITQIGGVLSMLLAYIPEWKLGNIETIGILLIIGLSVYILDRVRTKMNNQARRALSFVMCLSLLPFVIFIMLDMAQGQPFFIPRYFAHISLFLYTLIGVTAALGWKYGYSRAANLLFVTALALVSWGTVQLAQVGNYNYERLYWPHPTSIYKLVDCKKSMIIADDPYVYMELLNYFGDCDLRFYSSSPVQFEGGYAWLHNSPQRIASLSDITAKNVVHIYWSEVANPLQFDSRFRLLSSETYQKHVINTYEFIAE